MQKKLLAGLASGLGALALDDAMVAQIRNDDATTAKTKAEGNDAKIIELKEKQR